MSVVYSSFVHYFLPFRGYLHTHAYWSKYAMVSTQHYNMAHSFSMYVYSYIYNMYSNFAVSAEGRGKMLNTSIHSSSPRS